MQCQAIYVLHCNWLFKIIWNLIKLVLSSYIRGAVKLIKTKDLVKYFPKECLLEEHGGYSKYQYDQPHTEDIFYFYKQNGERYTVQGEKIVADL